MLLTISLLQVSDHHIVQPGVVSRFSFLGQDLACTATATASAALTITQCFHNLVVWLFSSSPFDLQIFIGVQIRLICVADLEILVDHPCDLPSRENTFFFLAR